MQTVGLILALILIYIVLDKRVKKINIEIYTKHCTEDYRFVVIADFHGGRPEEIIGKLLDEELDGSFIVGDFIDERRRLDGCDFLLEGLQKHGPIYYVSGNHEHKHPKMKYREIKKFLVDRDVVVLDNDFEIYEELNIIGFQDKVAYHQDQRDEKEKKNIKEAFKALPENKLNIVLMHRPEHAQLFDDYPVAVMISGHAHGGQVRFPGLLNGLYAPQQGFFPKRAGGQYDMPRGIHIVSRGLAKFFWLPRIFNRPELIILSIKAIKEIK